MTETDPIVVFDEDRDRASVIAGLLAADQSPSIIKFHEFSGDLDRLVGLPVPRESRPLLAIIVEADGSRIAFPGVAELLRKKGFATLAVVDISMEPAALAARVRNFDGWVALGSIESELVVRAIETRERVPSLHDRRPPASLFHAINPRFLALVVHDLRTPLNVIGLTLPAINRTVPHRSAELDGDLDFIKENAAQIEKMLATLGDFCQLNEGEAQVTAVEFDPRRFLADFVEDHRSKAKGDAPQVRLELTGTSPVEVSLDPRRVKLALYHALSNAISASGHAPVRIRSSGASDRWILELILETPPPRTVESSALSPAVYERLTGSAAERRGLDLAIAAHVSELFGGSARLVVEPDFRSTIVLDWPQRLEDR